MDEPEDTHDAAHVTPLKPGRAATAPDTPEQAEMRARLSELRQEHRALDSEIAERSETLLTDHLALKRLKKRKLQLKDEIARIEDELYPDIIA